MFSSTAATYGVPDNIPITEESLQKPINPYGAAKLGWSEPLPTKPGYQWGYAALRYFNAAGASRDGLLGEDHEPETHLIPQHYPAIQGKKPAIEVLGRLPNPGWHLCPRLHPCGRPAEAHLLALERLEPGREMRYNLGIGRGYSVREVIQAVEEVTGRRVPYREGPRRAGDPRCSWLPPTRFQREFGLGTPLSGPAVHY